MTTTPNLYSAPFAAHTNGTTFPVMGHHFATEAEVVNLATLFPSAIYFATQEV